MDYLCYAIYYRIYAIHNFILFSTIAFPSIEIDLRVFLKFFAYFYLPIIILVLSVHF